MFQYNEDNQPSFDIVDGDAEVSSSNRELLISELAQVAQGRQRMGAEEFIDLVRVVNAL